MAWRRARPTRRTGLLAVLALGLAVGTARAQDGVIDAAGRPVQPLAGAGGRVTVLVFTAVDCPISNRFAPELSRLATTFTARGVRFWLVYPNTGDPAAAVAAHAAAFGYPTPLARDVAGRLVEVAGATVTPEVAVFDGRGRLAYRGRIDDRYTDFGVDRPTPTTRDLADALEAVLAGRPVTSPVTRAIGCTIVRIAP